MNNLLYSGRNGDITVSIYEDGTSVRVYPGEGNPEQPLSMDMKITNSCAIGCKYCHESCTDYVDDGSNFQTILDRTKSLKPGIEIALGGGDIHRYPLLHKLMEEFHSRGFIVNCTVNAFSKDYFDYLRGYQQKGWLHGIGISVSENFVKEFYCSRASFAFSFKRSIECRDLKNVVIHVIAGLVKPDIVKRLLKVGFPVLILGYKRYGRGEDYLVRSGRMKKVMQGIESMKVAVRDILWDDTSDDSILSFDNLALEQLDIESMVSPTEWESRYMGDDGQFSMYYDAVSDEFAESSTDERQEFSEKIPDIKSAFVSLRSKRGF